MQSQQTILVVADTGSNRLLPGLILRPLGFSVLECADGQEGIELLAQTGMTGVLLDIQMPSLNYHEVLQRIKKTPLQRQTKIIAYTAQATLDDVQELLSQGFDAVLLKPIKSADLVKIVANW